jgi:hypothetical protein
MGGIRPKKKFHSIGALSSARGLPPDIRRRLVLAQSEVNGVTQEAVAGPGQEVISATSFGSTQCTRERTSGDPKRVERGGRH